MRTTGRGRRWFGLLLLLLGALFAPSHALYAAPAVAAKGDPLPVGRLDPSWGEDSAPVTMVLFSDLQCPYCKKLWATLGELQKDYGKKKLRIVFKHNPLPFHHNARPAAELGVAVHQLHGSDSFFRYVAEAHDVLLSGGSGKPADALGAMGVDAAAVQGLVTAGAPGRKVDSDVALAEKVGVRGTPAMFINGVFISGAQPKEELVKAIDDQLAQAQALAARGVAAADVSPTLTRAQFVAPDVRKGNAAAAPPPAEDTTTVWRVPADGSPSRGPRDALVTMVVFSDFQCPFCARLVPTLDALAKRYPDKLRIVFKHNPLPFHKRAEPAAELAVEAFKKKGDKGFWAMHDKLFESQRNLEDADLERIAHEIGLPPQGAMAAVTKSAHAKAIEADQLVAEDIGARGTPSSFINGRKLAGAQSEERFAALIDEEIAHAEKLLAAGTPRAKLYATIIKDGKTTPIAERLAKSLPAPTAQNPQKGPANAKVTMHVFSDFQCPFCKRVQGTLAELEKDYQGRIRIVFHHMPLDFHSDARPAHEAAAEAFRQKGNAAFWKLHDKIYASDDLARGTLLGLAGEVGLDTTQVGQAIDAGSHAQAIEDDAKLAEDAGIHGTPAFVINDYVVSGAQPARKFKRVIDTALREAGGKR